MTPLISGISKRIGPDDQAVIASWVALKSGICEFDDRDSIAITQEERAFIFANHAPPPHWRIWIGNYEGSGYLTYHSHTCFMFAKSDAIAKRVSIDDLKKNLQATTFVAERLFIHVRSSSERAFLNFRHFKPMTGLMLTQIFPTVNCSIDWPTFPPISDADVAEIRYPRPVSKD